MAVCELPVTSVVFGNTDRIVLEIRVGDAGKLLVAFVKGAGVVRLAPTDVILGEANVSELVTGEATLFRLLLAAEVHGFHEFTEELL